MIHEAGSPSPWHSACWPTQLRRNVAVLASQLTQDFSKGRFRRRHIVMTSVSVTSQLLKCHNEENNPDLNQGNYYFYETTAIQKGRSNVKDVAIDAKGLRFNFQAGQIGHSVTR